MAMNAFWLQQSAADVPAENDWLSAGEALHLNGMHFAKRRADWRLGRWTAKCAVSAYLAWPAETGCLSAIEIRPAPSGAPQIFIAGQLAAIAVSLSHRAGTAIAAVVEPCIALGCDLELTEPRSDTFVSDYFTPEEQSFLARAPARDRDALATLVWSAKESALKSMRQGLRLDTRSVLVHVRDGGEISADKETFTERGALAGEDVASQGPQEFWRALEVLHLADGHTLRGWWQRTCKLVRTLIADPPLLPPVLLQSRLPGKFSSRSSR